MLQKSVYTILRTVTGTSFSRTWWRCSLW